MILLRFFPQQLALLQRRAFTDEIEFADCRGFRTSVLLTFISFDVDIEVESKTHFGEISVEACFTRITFFVFQIFRPRLPPRLDERNPEEKSPMKISIEFPASLISFSCISAALHTGRRQPAQKSFLKHYFQSSTTRNY